MFWNALRNKWFLHGLDTLAFLLLFCNFLSKLCIWSNPVNLWKAELREWGKVSLQGFLWWLLPGKLSYCIRFEPPAVSEIHSWISKVWARMKGDRWGGTSQSCGEIADRSCVQRDTGLLLEILGDWCSWGVFVSVGKGCLNFPGEALSWTWAIAMGGVSICVRGAEHAI